MKAVRVYMVSLFLLLTTVSSVSAQEQAYKPVYYDVVQKLMEYEFENSDVMETANMLTNIFAGAHRVWSHECPP